MIGGGIFTWVIIGVVLYLLLSKKGGVMGCCGGHGGHPPDHPGRNDPSTRDKGLAEGEIIDLKKEDYHVQS